MGTYFYYCRELSNGQSQYIDISCSDLLRLLQRMKQTHGKEEESSSLSEGFILNDTQPAMAEWKAGRKM